MKTKASELRKWAEARVSSLEEGEDADAARAILVLLPVLEAAEKIPGMKIKAGATLWPPELVAALAAAEKVIDG